MSGRVVALSEERAAIGKMSDQIERLTSRRVVIDRLRTIAGTTRVVGAQMRASSVAGAQRATESREASALLLIDVETLQVRAEGAPIGEILERTERLISRRVVIDRLVAIAGTTSEVGAQIRAVSVAAAQKATEIREASALLPIDAETLQVNAEIASRASTLHKGNRIDRVCSGRKCRSMHADQRAPV